MENTSRQTEPVLVTGGSGYLAGHIIVRLLADGRSVRTTVRKISKADEIRAALERHAPTDKLEIFEADLLSDSGWDEAVGEAEHVIHVASPMPVREYRKQDLERPAREGVRRVLSASLRSRVRRVVMTSSTAAAIPKKGEVSSEATWTDLSEKGISPYARSKTFAEGDAWRAIGKRGNQIELATVLPGMVQGPTLGSPASGSLEVPLRMLTGRLPLVPRVSFGGVDVRDVAELHVRALTDPRANGRRIIAAGEPLWLRDMAVALKIRLGDRATKVSTREAPDWLIRALALFSPEARFLAADLGKQRNYDASLAEELLGRPLFSLEQAMADAGESLFENGLV